MQENMQQRQPETLTDKSVLKRFSATMKTY